MGSTVHRATKPYSQSSDHNNRHVCIKTDVHLSSRGCFLLCACIIICSQVQKGSSEISRKAVLWNQQQTARRRVTTALQLWQEECLIPTGPTKQRVNNSSFWYPTLQYMPYIPHLIFMMNFQHKLSAKPFWSQWASVTTSSWHTHTILLISLHT